ncbi:MAG: tetratricopeptide repeat protein, partial [Myxococcales bacterium]|nr:tetratricopeptide repeat protein [Myxococcales bacterium]
EAVSRYDRVADEFPRSPYASPALYNAGLCFVAMGQVAQAVARYERLLQNYPESEDIPHARFQLLAAYNHQERWNDALAMGGPLLEDRDLTPEGRLEAMARMSQAFLGAGRFAEARRLAMKTLAYHKEHGIEGNRRDAHFAGAANFVLADSYRRESEAIEIPPATAEEQHEILEQRAALLLQAQREYFDTMRYTDPEWAAASGYQIGAMYDRLWTVITTAPIPPPKNNYNEEGMRIYREEYRKEMAKQVRPLVQHAIRYWELTLMMIERTQVDTEWTERLKADLERVRERTLGGGTSPQGTAPAP